MQKYLLSQFINFMLACCKKVLISLKVNKYTVHLESIHSASLFPYFVMLQSYSKMD